MKKSERTKEDMIHAVIDLIEETGNTDFSIGMIARKADVAIGLINYHYASKQALIVEAVKHCIEEQIKHDNVFLINEKLPSSQLLSTSLKSYADFLVQHSFVSRLHIKYTLDGTINDDSLSAGITYYLPIISSMNPKLSKELVLTSLKMIVSTIQISFLEADIAKNSTGFDFFCKEERDRFIDNMIFLIIGS